MVKLFKRDFKLSFLCYPDFSSYPYPSLRRSHTVDLTKKSHRTASYTDSENPPILHRRELFLYPDNPNVEIYRAFTQEGEDLGLYSNTRIIGTLNGWHRVIRRSGKKLDVEGHIVPLELTSTLINKKGSVESIERHKTAISRDKLSLPMFSLARLGYLNGEYSVLDYGCGRGDDIRELEAHEIDCIGWDPAFHPDTCLEPCDIVNLGYVINVIEDQEERAETVRKAYELCSKLIVISAMLGNETVYVFVRNRSSSQQRDECRNCLKCVHSDLLPGFVQVCAGQCS